MLGIRSLLLVCVTDWSSSLSAFLLDMIADNFQAVLKHEVLESSSAFALQPVFFTLLVVKSPNSSGKHSVLSVS